MTAAALLVCLLPNSVSAEPEGPLNYEPGELVPGLVAKYRSSGDDKPKVTCIEPKAAFYLGRSSPHPRIPPGPFEVTWSGVISIKERGAISFSAFVGGELNVTVDGVGVLDGRGQTDTTLLTAKNPLKREPGFYRFTVKYKSLADVPARLQIWWEGEAFAKEPLPAWRLYHEASDSKLKSVSDERQFESGRIAAGQFGCARCHSSALPAIHDPPPGPSLADANLRLNKNWLMVWLADPSKVRPGAHMPGLFSDDRTGFVERWLIAQSLSAPKRDDTPSGNHRQGRITFMSVGCTACHLVPDIDEKEQRSNNHIRLTGLGDRMNASDIATFLSNPHSRYPDGRMPRIPLTRDEARDIAAYLLLWSKPTEIPAGEAPKADEILAVMRKLGARDQAASAATLLHDRGCTACHAGLGETRALDVPIKDKRGLFSGCHISGKSVKYHKLNSADVIEYYLTFRANQEKYPSPFTIRQDRLRQVGCVRCHQRDSDQPSPIEEIGSTLGGAFLQEIPFLRTPRLTNLHQKFIRSYLASTVREGISGLRWSRFSYRMPAFGHEADTLLQALAEADGELPTEADPPATDIADPTLGVLHGSQLAGFQGYACVSCHVWNGKLLGSPDPVATGPDLTRTVGRIRRSWFDAYLESPLRFHPGTPMPGVFPHRKPAMLASVLDGDTAKQKEALWAYLAKGKDAPSPAPPPPVPTPAPGQGEPIIVAQIPIRMPDGKAIESICLLTADHDLLIYDLGEGKTVAFFTGGQILRNVQGRIRQFLATGTAVELKPTAPELSDQPKPKERVFLGYDRLDDGVRLRWLFHFEKDTAEVQETLRFVNSKETRQLVRELKVGEGKLKLSKFDLPPAKTPPAWSLKPVSFPDDPEGSLERPGYKAIMYPRPKTVSGEDRIMPGAVAVRPKDGQVFIASMKSGELFALRDPTGDGKNAKFENYAHGLYQDALSMLAEADGLYVLHRRNLTKITEKDGVASRFERVALLPHGIADTYDMAYGLARDKEGNFIYSYAPYASTTISGSGSALRLKPGKPPGEVAFGMRNPLGWCAGTDGEVFFTDNQGDWVATNKLCHVTEGRFFGWPNRAQPQHISKPPGKPTVWVPYGWARSINGVSYDNTGGKFGPFAGQFFMAELMFGGAIVRANVEKVNGVYQGACFPFWGKGLLGPLTLAFDPRGKLYVGSITEPGWMAQPDRGALFRIDYTGETPFEMQSMHVRPHGFRIIFTRPVNLEAAKKLNGYQLESYRYEYTGAYGSPELDRTQVKIQKVEVAPDGLSVELTTAPLVKDRVYLLTLDADVIRPAKEGRLANNIAAYTLNEIPEK
jgi:glucose/arabinose dehydrogenase/mono/diheme cytochrome c family protein